MRARTVRAALGAAVLVVASGLAAGPPAAAGNPPPPLQFSVADASVVEGDGTDAALSFVVHLSRPHPVATSVPWSTVAGTAGTPDDFAAASGTARFERGETAVTVAVPVVGDDVDEDDETMELRLGRPSAGRVVDDAGTGSIVDDDDTVNPTEATLTVTLPDIGRPTTHHLVTGFQISCGFDETWNTWETDCEATYAYGSDVRLLVSSSEIDFLGWTGACEHVGTERTCILTMTDDLAVGVILARPMVHMAVIGAGTVRDADFFNRMNCTEDGGPSCDIGYPPNSEVAWSATPAPGWQFVGWTGVCEGSPTPCTFQFPASVDYDVAAVFEQT